MAGRLPLTHIFEDGNLSSYMQVQVGGQKLLHNSILNLWLNGTQYHTDQAKAESWRKLEASLTENNARALAIELIHSRCKALMSLDHIAQLVLQRHATYPPIELICPVKPGHAAHVKR